jgi:hypothetical protein
MGFYVCYFPTSTSSPVVSEAAAAAAAPAARDHPSLGSSTQVRRDAVMLLTEPLRAIVQVVASLQGPLQAWNYQPVMSRPDLTANPEQIFGRWSPKCVFFAVLQWAVSSNSFSQFVQETVGPEGSARRMERASASPARVAPRARTPTQEGNHTHTALAGFAGIRARSRKSQTDGPLSRRDSPDRDAASAERTRAPTGTPDPHGLPTGLISVMAQWVDGGESNIHSICETLRSCVEAGELVESTPLHLEIEACAASRPSVSLRGKSPTLKIIPAAAQR